MFHALAGALAGSIFKVRVLYLLVGVIVVESLVSAFVEGSIVVLWALLGIIGIEIGYLAGICARSLLEYLFYLRTDARTRRVR
jgi:hypothetical protein